MTKYRAFYIIMTGEAVRCGCCLQIDVSNEEGSHFSAETTPVRLLRMAASRRESSSTRPSHALWRCYTRFTSPNPQGRLRLSMFHDIRQPKHHRRSLPPALPKISGRVGCTI
jgi:hypothetical protein